MSHFLFIKKKNIIFSFRVDCSLLSSNYGELHVFLDRFDWSLDLFYLFYQAVQLWFRLYSSIYLLHKVQRFYYLWYFSCFLFYVYGLCLNGILSLFKAWVMCLNQSRNTCSFAWFFFWLFEGINCFVIAFIEWIIRFRQSVCQVLKLLRHSNSLQQLFLSLTYTIRF